MRDTDNGALRFRKMHGLGNDFVVLDARARPVSVTSSHIQRIADRHRGVGFDQLVIIEPGTHDVHLRFFNADGSASATCGNATRCVARLIMDETGRDAVTLTTDHGPLAARRDATGAVAVNMGQPQTDWQAIPLAEAVDTLTLPLPGAPTATSMGNPHCTFFVDDLAELEVTTIGPEIETHALFPQRTNVQVAQCTAPDTLRVRVWERGVGLTLASGSSSCAVAVAAVRRGLTARTVDVVLDGGTIGIDWREDGVWMTGATSYVFDGVFTRGWLEGVA